MKKPTMITFHDGEAPLKDICIFWHATLIWMDGVKYRLQGKWIKEIA